MDSKINKNVLIICKADPSSNPRPRRAIELCLDLGLTLSVFSFPPKDHNSRITYFHMKLPGNGVVEKIMRRLYGIAASFLPLKQGQFVAEAMLYGFYEGFQQLRENQIFDILIVENIELLPMAFLIKNKAKIIFDAREYYSRELEGDIWFDLVIRRRREQILKEYLDKCDSVITVSEGLAQAYEKHYNVKPVVIRSTPNYVDLQPGKVEIHKFRMVHHGNAHRDRSLEDLIEIVKSLDDRFYLDLYLVGKTRYINELKTKGNGCSRVRIRESITYDNLIKVLSEYDIGLIYFPPTTFNLEACLPNKFFEFIQARLMLAIGPTPDMSTLVEKYQLGVVAEKFSVESMVSALSELTAEKINKAKENSNRAASVLCFEEESKELTFILESLLR